MKRITLLILVITSAIVVCGKNVTTFIDALNKRDIESALRLCEKNLKLDSIEVNKLNEKTFDDVVESLLELNRYTDIVKLLDVLLSSGTEERLLVEWGSNKAIVLQDCIGDFIEAEKVYSWLLPMASRVLGPKSMDYEEIVNNAATLYGDWGKYEDAERLLKEAIVIVKNVVGVNDAEYGYVLNNMAVLYEEMGKYEESVSLAQEALSVYEKAVGKEDVLYAAVLRTLANLKIRKGLYFEALPISKEASRIYKSAGDDELYSYASSLITDAIIQTNLGDYEAAERLYLMGLRIKESVVGKEHIDYAMSIEDLGGLYIQMGNFKQAENILTNALDIYEKTEGCESVDYGWCLQRLGKLHAELGNTDAAIDEYKKCLEVWKKTVGVNHQNYAQTLNYLAMANCDAGDYGMAVNLYREALSIYKELFEENYAEYAITLQNLGVCYVYMDDYERADSLLSVSQSIIKQTLGEKHPYYAALLEINGFLNYKKENYLNAESCYVQALDIVKQIYGEKHPIYEDHVFKLSLLYATIGAYEHAWPYIMENFSLQKELIGQQFSFLSESERKVFLKKYENSLRNFYPSVVLASGNLQEWSRFIYDDILFEKGLLLTTTRLVQKSILESGNQELMEKWNELRRLREYINVLQYKNGDEQVKTDLDELCNRAESLDKQLTKESSLYRDYLLLNGSTTADVQREIHEGEVAVEFFNFEYWKNGEVTDSTMYCALLLQADGEPEMIPLFEEKSVVQMLSKDSLEDIYSFDKEGKILTEMVWGQILKRVNMGDKIYYSPSGILHKLALAALPFDGEKNVGDIYNMVMLSSTRELIKSNENISHESAVLYGGLVYNEPLTKLNIESKRYKENDNELAMRGICDNIDRGNADYLLGTKVEVQQIEKILARRNIKVDTFSSTKGNEESFKSLSGKHKSILHIATHGFYWNDSVAQNRRYIIQRFALQDNLHLQNGIDPMERCGLLMSGANVALSGRIDEIPSEVEDGILTAKEISFLDLSGVDVVVLSACETALGDVSGDDVYGLQRAFKQAGVKTIVMSLWPVGDEATQLFMTAFYSKWINDGCDKREAFKYAQRMLQKEKKDIRAWGGFVMLD